MLKQSSIKKNANRMSQLSVALSRDSFSFGFAKKLSQNCKNKYLKILKKKTILYQAIKTIKKKTG